MVHPSYIARKLALNDEARLVWRLNPNKGRLAAHDRGAGPVVKLLGHDYPEPVVIDALNKGLGLTPPKPERRESKRKLPPSGHRGIHALPRGRFVATATRLGRSVHVGTFYTLEDAIAARDEFVRRNNL